MRFNRSLLHAGAQSEHHEQELRDIGGLRAYEGMRVCQVGAILTMVPERVVRNAEGEKIVTLK